MSYCSSPSPFVAKDLTVLSPNQTGPKTTEHESSEYRRQVDHHHRHRYHHHHHHNSWRAMMAAVCFQAFDWSEDVLLIAQQNDILTAGLAEEKKMLFLVTSMLMWRVLLLCILSLPCRRPFPCPCPFVVVVDMIDWPIWANSLLSQARLVISYDVLTEGQTEDWIQKIWKKKKPELTTQIGVDLSRKLNIHAFGLPIKMLGYLLYKPMKLIRLSLLYSQWTDLCIDNNALLLAWKMKYQYTTTHQRYVPWKLFQSCVYIVRGDILECIPDRKHVAFSLRSFPSFSSSHCKLIVNCGFMLCRHVTSHCMICVDDPGTGWERSTKSVS